MARNKIEDLRNHLFASMERLNDDDLTAEQIELETRKAKSLAQLSSAIIESAKLEINYLQATDQSESKTQLFKDLNSSSEKSLIEKL